jgi:hypothetical protein
VRLEKLENRMARIAPLLKSRRPSDRVAYRSDGRVVKAAPPSDDQRREYRPKYDVDLTKPGLGRQNFAREQRHPKRSVARERAAADSDGGGAHRVDMLSGSDSNHTDNSSAESEPTNPWDSGRTRAAEKRAPGIPADARGNRERGAAEHRETDSGGSSDERVNIRGQAVHLDAPSRRKRVSPRYTNRSKRGRSRERPAVASASTSRNTPGSDDPPPDVKAGASTEEPEQVRHLLARVRELEEGVRAHEQQHGEAVVSLEQQLGEERDHSAQTQILCDELRSQLDEAKAASAAEAADARARSFAELSATAQVRKTPSWPRSWANCSLL